MVDPNSNTMNDWNAFAEEMWNAVTGLPILTGQQAKTRWNDTLKPRHKAWQKLITFSGGGGNEDGVGSMTDEAWTEVITAHPEVAEFRHAPFEFAVHMHQAFAGKVATFEHAVTVTNLQAELSGTPKSHKVPVRSGDKRRRSGGRVGVSEAGGRAPGSDADAAAADGFSAFGAYFEAKTESLKPQAAPDGGQAQIDAFDVLSTMNLSELTLGLGVDMLLDKPHLCRSFVLMKDNVRRAWLKAKLGAGYTEV